MNLFQPLFMDKKEQTAVYHYFGRKCVHNSRIKNWPKLRFIKQTHNAFKIYVAIQLNTNFVGSLVYF
jgi:hypothetical protein